MPFRTWPGGNVPGPAHHRRHAHAAFVRRHLLAAERSRAAVGPGAVLRTVVRRVDDDRVVERPCLAQRLEQRADLHVVLDHAAAVEVVAARLLRGKVPVLRPQVRVQVHAAGVEPGEPGLALRLRALDEGDGRVDELVVHRLHALDGERAGVLAALPADATESRLLGRVVDVGCDALQYAARPVLRQEFRVLGIVELLRLLLFVQVIEVAVELVEAVHGRQALVAIAEVVLAELSRRVTLRLQYFGQRRSRGLDSQRVAGQADRRHAAADRVLAGDECGATRGAGWLRIVVGEHRAFAADAIDVRRGVAHDAGVVEAEVRPADVVPEDHQDVGPGSGSGTRPTRAFATSANPDAINACNAMPIRDWNK